MSNTGHKATRAELLRQVERLEHIVEVSDKIQQCRYYVELKAAMAELAAVSGTETQ